MVTNEIIVPAPEERRDRYAKDTRPVIDARKVAVTFKVENGTV
jgi:peptide/nickel transport system ATP-binding protein